MSKNKHITSAFSQIFGKFASKSFPTPIQNIINHGYVRLMGLDMSAFAEPSSYETLNKLFTRHLKEEREFNKDEKIMISPCDSLVSECGKIHDFDSFQIKGMKYKVDELLGKSIDSKNKHRVKNGRFINFYLSPSDYHRYHIPINCRITKAVHIPGKLYPVNFTYLNKQQDLFIENERVVIECFTQDDELFYMVLVGALNVGKMEVSFEPNIQTNSDIRESVMYEYEDLNLNKGDDFGCFQMGSTIVIISEKMDIFVQSGEKVNFAQDIASFKK
ncbi:phosphatidylserine decarboxylase [Sulfurimonas sp. MAG313]|nr:phosphatidylserine decarboxylase [Sulfurimonas sp. MAG313]MDF1880076.1 phosphatidylserine decarboxylase [Sulfurimonas sp. MAG313]